jgi:hypothetical protein
MDPRIADYIRDNQRRYTKRALTDQLLEAGYSREAIDATWAILETPDQDSTAGQGFWGRFWLFLIGANVVVFLGVMLLTGMLADLGSGGAILAIILAIAMAIFALVAWGIVAITRPATLSPRTALAIGTIVPLFFALLVGGTCYALVGGLRLGGSSQRSEPIAGSMQIALANGHFSASGGARCASESSGFSLRADDLAIEPVSATVSIDVVSFTEPTDAALSVIFHVVDQPDAAYTTGSRTQVVVDPSATSASGSLRFIDLASTTGDESTSAPEAQPISGTISWQC